MSENIFREMAIDKISKQIKSIISSVAPLLKIENGIPIIQGTCSFVKFESQKFILTAKHVLEDYDNQLYINLEYNTHKIFKPGGESFLDKENDIGIIMLDIESINRIESKYVFLELISNQDNDKNNKYSFIGFPESRGRFNKYSSDKINIEPIIYTSILVEQERLGTYDIDNSKNISIYYIKKEVVNISNNKISIGPDLYGVSGCLLIKHNDINFKIVGILTTWLTKNRDILIGPNITLVNKLLLYAINKRQQNI